jgi:hypothetical protein
MTTTHMLAKLTGLEHRHIEHRMKNRHTLRVPDHDAIIEMYRDRKSWLKWKNSGQTWPDGFDKSPMSD